MSSRRLTIDESMTLKRYMSMSTNELIRDLNYSLLPKSNAENITDMVRGRFFVLSDIKTLVNPSIVSSRTNLFLSETRGILKSNQSFMDSLGKFQAQNPTDEELITFIYVFLEEYGDRRRSQMRIAAYICRVGINKFLNLENS